MKAAKKETESNVESGVVHSSSFWHWPALLVGGLLVLFVVSGGPLYSVAVNTGPSRLMAGFGLVLRPHVEFAYYSKSYYNYLVWWARVGGFAGAFAPHGEYVQMVDEFRAIDERK